ncbi:MAG: hypothetical protein H0W61_17525, partial [Bacteroidetes bacterium]|nr:hypothetical protein [Bacteroidota bacterium]
MTGFPDKHFNRIFFATCSVVFAVICLRAFFIPFSHDEAATFYFYIQPSDFLPYKAHLYTNNHVLNSALSTLCYHLGGSHPFILRIPNILSFLLLCLGVFRFFKYLNRTSAKIILILFFILTFNFLDFFELCRGYGLSIGFMIAGLAYLQDYFTTRKFKYLLLFSLFWQLALAANLTLVVLLTVLLFFIFIYQLKNRLFLEIKNLILQVVNLALLYFWIKFALFYKEAGALDSGVGESYWEVSFKSLMLFVFGTDYLWLQAVIVVLFALSLLFGMYSFFKNKFALSKIFEPSYFYLLLLSTFITAFYLQKKLLHINYPEDRTGLFFYLFFSLSVTFLFDQLPSFSSKLFAAIFSVYTVVHLFIAFNLASFNHYFYHVMPPSFYSYLENESQKNADFFTVGGNKSREMIYTFENYRHGSPLNTMDDAEEMQMNCDYYYALKLERPYYRFFYDEVAYDDRWDRVLLKRKQKITRTEIQSLTLKSKEFKSSDEFLGFISFSDTSLASRNCIETDFDITFKNVPSPFNAFLVCQVSDSLGNNAYYKRVQLNWIAPSLNNQSKRFKLTTGPLPAKFTVTVYLWNIKKQPVEITLNKLRIHQLYA